MSTQVNHYIILGVKLPFSKEDSSYEKLEQYLDSAYNPKREGFLVLYDGRGGEYIVAGHVLSATDELSDGGYGFENPVVINPTSKEITAVKRDLEDKLGIKNAEVRPIVVTHLR